MISFIIPAYNAGKTIGRTIKSITNQEGTSVDYEVIVVDDGSDDDLREKVEEFKSDERIKYFYKENTGVSDTRNYGVNQAMGEYIIFVDSDDYISKTLLKDIEQYINQKIDLIKWRPVFVDEDGNIMLDNNNHVNQWIIEDSVFRKKYEIDPENPTLFKPKGGPQIFVQINDNIILNQWGEDMKIAAGGYINITNINDMYGISERDFNDTYQFTEEQTKGRKR